MKYRFNGVATRKKAGELLIKLRKSDPNVVGCVIFYSDRAVELEFEKTPTKEELENIKVKLNAADYEQVQEEQL